MRPGKTSWLMILVGSILFLRANLGEFLDRRGRFGQGPGS